MKLALLAFVLLAACKGSSAKMTMTPADVIGAVRDYADRGCACGTDKECFHAIRDEWEENRKSLLYNANLMTGADRDAYNAERLRFGLCGDAAGLTVFDGV